MSDLSQEAWTSQLKQDKNAVVIDVRTAEEVEFEGYIPGALFKDIFQSQEFLEWIDTLDKTKNYYVYCRSGNRSGQACAVMNHKGFENAFNLMGGFMNWHGEVEKIS